MLSIQRKIFFLIICIQFSIQTCCAIVEDSNANITLNLKSITLSKAIELGVLNNPTLKAARAKLGVSDAQILQAGLLSNPNIISDNGFAEDTFRVGIEQTIELGNKRSRRIKLAKMQKEVVHQEIITTMLDVRSKVRSSYIQTYNAQQKLLASREILETITNLEKIAKEREKKGNVENLDILQAEITVINAKNNIQSAKLELNEAFNSLSANIGKHLNRTIVLAPPDLMKEFNISTSMVENDKTINTLIEYAYANRPEIKAIEKNIEVQNQKLKLAHSNIVPDLKMTVGADFVTGNTKRNSTFVMGSLGVPIFNRQQGVIKEVKAQKLVYENDLDAIKIKIEQEVKNAYFGVIANAKSLNIYEKELIPHAKKIVKKSEISFKEGKSNILIPINSQEAYINTQYRYIQTLTQYEQSVSDLERAIGLYHK